MAVFTVAERDQLSKSIFSLICTREFYDKTQGRWITIRGAKVKIGDDGTIEHGPERLKKHIEEQGGFRLGQDKEKIGRGIGTESKFAETSKGKQVNLFHGMNDKPGQGKLFEGLDNAGATAADLKPEPKEPAKKEPEPVAEAPAWHGLRQSGDEAAAAGKNDIAARRYNDAADNHPESNGDEAKELRGKAASLGKTAEKSPPAIEPLDEIKGTKPTRTATKLANEARMHKAMADYYRGIADKQNPAEAKRLKALADDHDRFHAEKTAKADKSGKPAADNLTKPAESDAQLKSASQLPATDPKALHEVDGPENTRARVFKGENGYNVAVQDKDSGSTLPTMKSFPTLDAAKSHADTIKEPSKEPPKIETPPQAPKAVTSEPKKNLLHALTEKGSPEAKEMPTAAAIARGDGPHRIKNELGEKPPPGVTVGPGGIWQGSATLHAEDINTDPGRFQYKVSGVGSKGVTKQLQDVKRFNPMFGGQAMVWRDPADGKTYVINGHHRLELAQRSPHYQDESTGLDWKGEMQSFYIPAKTAAQARAMGALANMAAGHGTATDAAKFMRDTGMGTEALKDQGISLKGKVASDAVALKDLSQRSFDDMVRGALPESRAVAVAKHVKDPERQDQLLRKLAARESAGRPVSDDDAEQAAKEISLAGSTQERGGGLFGDMGEHTLEIERGEVKSAIRKAIASERNTFKAVSSAKRAGRLSESGNVLDVEGNRQRAEQADETLGLFDTLANSKSGVSKEIQQAAEQYYHEPGKRDEIIKGLVNRLPGIIESDWREFKGDKPAEPETYSRRVAGVHSRGEGYAGAGNHRTRDNGAGSLEFRTLRNAVERALLIQSIRPAIETYALGWDESKHKRGQPANAGQFGPGGGHTKSPQAKAASAPAAKAPSNPTGSQAPHGTSSADYTPTKALQPSKPVSGNALRASLEQGRTPQEALTDNMAHKSPAVQAVERDYPPANKDGNDTLERHRMSDGSFTPQRKALHDKIIGSIVSKVPPSADRTFYMMGGGPAAGKGSILSSGQVTLPAACHIDSDAIKTQLPEYAAMQGAKDMRAACFCHEESSGLAKTAIAQGFSGGQNVLLDGTGNASLDGVKSKANAARQAGYKVHAEYVTCDVEEAVRRNIERAKKTGRLPPEAMLRHTHKTVSQILPQAIAAGVFDHVRLWDTQNKDADGKPSLVASGSGTQLTVHNQQLWDTFLAKGK